MFPLSSVDTEGEKCLSYIQERSDFSYNNHGFIPFGILILHRAGFGYSFVFIYFILFLGSFLFLFFEVILAIPSLVRCSFVFIRYSTSVQSLKSFPLIPKTGASFNIGKTLVKISANFSIVNL